jgi:hypothetical protein
VRPWFPGWWCIAVAVEVVFVVEPASVVLHEEEPEDVVWRWARMTISPRHHFGGVDLREKIVLGIGYPWSVKVHLLSFEPRESIAFGILGMDMRSIEPRVVQSAWSGEISFPMHGVPPQSSGRSMEIGI